MAILIFTGNIVKTEEKPSKDGGKLLVITFAENKGTGGNQKTNYFDCAGKIGGVIPENLVQYLTVGKGLLVNAELNKVINDVDGKKYFNDQIFINTLEFLPMPKKKSEEEVK